MKKIKYILIALLLTFQIFVFAQQKMDSVRQTDSSSINVNPKDLRKEKDSLAKNLAPITDKSIVYIIRNNYSDMLVPYRLDYDSFQIGWVKSRTYLYSIVDPGDHVFISYVPAGNEYRLKASLEPGKIYYLELYYAIGLLGSVVKMKILNEEKGRKDLMTCNISKHNQYPLFPKSKEVETFPPDDK
jgi:hypothetical protein